LAEPAPTNDALVKFLYLLGRDDLPLGRVEALLARIDDTPTVMSNHGLAEWAHEAAARLRP
jgi:hypothetical protein